VEKYVRPQWGDTPLNKITRKALQSWVTNDLTPGRSPAYVHRIYAVLRGSLTCALGEEVLGASPCVGIKLPKIRKKPRPYVDQAHLEALTQPSDGFAAMADPGHRALVAVAYETGLRPGELCGMHVDQVDLETGWLEVTRVYVQRRKMIRAWPKDKDSRRVPLTNRAAAILRSLLVERGTQGCGVPHIDGSECSGDLVFRNRTGIPITQGALHKALQRAAKRAGVEHKSAYALRRGAFTWMAEASVDPFTIAAIAGHEDVKLTTGYVQRTSAARDKLRAARGEMAGLSVIEGGAPTEGHLVPGLDRTPDWRIVEL
jgi:integrase